MMEVEKSFFSHYPDPQTAVHLAQLIPANRTTRFTWGKTRLENTVVFSSWDHMKFIGKT